MSDSNRQVILISHPEGMPTEANFALREAAMPKPREGEVLVKSLYISVDPYMRALMSERSSYMMSTFQLNEPITGGVVGKVVESKSPQFNPGDTVIGFLNWADYSVANGADLKQIDQTTAPASTALGVLGMPGMTAYFGLLEIGQPQKDETVVISGAAGAVGGLVGQIAKIKGARTVGIAGSNEKINLLTKELGFDAAVNYKSPRFAEELKKACPKGVDVYFDNVGGTVTDNVLSLLNRSGRMVVCGQISQYNQDKPDIGPRPFLTFLNKGALMKGFLVMNYYERFPEGLQQMAQWIKEGKLKYKETITNGLENTPKAFIALFKGENIGKQLVKL
jgi:NADPH-dependent curcumin reductase CurA